MEIIDAARAAPSNFNSQPWRVYLLTGKAKDAFGEAITPAHHDNTTPPFRLFLSRCQRIAQRALMSSASGIIRRLALIGQI
jgi:nitroreductase